MKKLILITIVFFNLQLSSCQKSRKIATTSEPIEKSITDQFFKEFTTIYGDNGLLQTGNTDLKKGSFEIYLISKNGAKQWFDNLNAKNKYEITMEKLNHSSPNEIAQDFDIWVFYTNKKYLTELEDQSLGNKIPGLVELYYLKAGTNKWEKTRKYQLKTEDDKIKFNDWKQKILEEILSLSNKQIINPSSELSAKWIGTYNAYFSYGQIAGENAGWNLKIEISNDTIKATGDGYQISFSDVLTAKEDDKKLILYHCKNISGYTLGEKMNPEIILTEDKENYFVKTKWIDKDIITKSTTLGFEISKEKAK